MHGLSRTPATTSPYGLVVGPSGATTCHDMMVRHRTHAMIRWLFLGFIHDQWCAHSTLVVSDISSPSTYRALKCIRKNAIKFLILYARVTNYILPHAEIPWNVRLTFIEKSRKFVRKIFDKLVLAVTDAVLLGIFHSKHSIIR